MAERAGDLAADLLDQESWFNSLHPSLKDEQSLPNHLRTMRDKGIALAQAVLREEAHRVGR